MLEMLLSKSTCTSDWPLAPLFFHLLPSLHFVSTSNFRTRTSYSSLCSYWFTQASYTDLFLNHVLLHGLLPLPSDPESWRSIFLQKVMNFYWTICFHIPEERLQALHIPEFVLIFYVADL
jgi:hypothetical protein